MGRDSTPSAWSTDVKRQSGEGPTEDGPKGSLCSDNPTKAAMEWFHVTFSDRMIATALKIANTRGIILCSEDAKLIASDVEERAIAGKFGRKGPIHSLHDYLWTTIDNAVLDWAKTAKRHSEMDEKATRQRDAAPRNETEHRRAEREQLRIDIASDIAKSSLAQRLAEITEKHDAGEAARRARLITKTPDAVNSAQPLSKAEHDVRYRELREIDRIARGKAREMFDQAAVDEFFGRETRKPPSPRGDEGCRP